jgi:hypothetical protein
MLPAIRRRQAFLTFPRSARMRLNGLNVLPRALGDRILMRLVSKYRKDGD